MICSTDGIKCGERTLPEVKLIITSVIKSGIEIDQLKMLSLAFEIRTDVAAKWSVSALFFGFQVIFQKYIHNTNQNLTDPL